MSKWTKDLINEIMTNESVYRKDFDEIYIQVSQSGAVYMDAPVPFHYIPRIYELTDIKNFETAMSQMFGVVNKTIDLYLEKEDVRALYNFDKRLEELILLDHGYKTKVPMGRFDIFYYDDGSYMFCELNTDGSSAMNEEAELSRILQHNKISNHIKESHDLHSFELFDSWVDEVKNIYQEFKHVDKKKDKPHVAILDFVDKGASLEFKVFQEHFEQSGMECSLVDPRDIICKEGWMTVNDKPIDIVYRRLVTKDLMDRYEEIPEFIKGLKEQKTCVIGSLKSQIVHTKLFFALLHDERVRQYFTKEELEFIDQCIPQTHVLEASSPLDDYIKNKDLYILKPIDYYASKGVIAGESLSKLEWKEVLIEKTTQSYLIQKYCPLAMRESLLPNEDGGFDTHRFRTITGMYVYNEKVKGIYSRAGLNAIIAGIHDGFTLSSLVATPK